MGEFQGDRRGGEVLKGIPEFVSVGNGGIWVLFDSLREWLLYEE